MEYIETHLKGSYLIKPDMIEDNRGYFNRLYFEDEIIEHGLSPVGIQCNSAFNYKKGTLRGMHYQISGYEQDKLVRCTKGSIYDVMIDLRRDSKTYCGWYSANLTELNGYMLYVPKGFAHGYITVEDNTEIFYQLSQKYVKEYESGIKYDDPAFGILWPVKMIVISERDLNHPKYEK